MPLSRLLLAWALVGAWFLVWEELGRRLAPRAGVKERQRGVGAWFRAHGRLPLAEAALLTLVAGLWFGSLGHGGWGLLFALLGLLIEVPSRFRFGHRATDGGMRRWVLIAAGVGRVLVAGGLLAWRLD
ncbi:MAG TPA: hypothetical protein VNK43_09460 [Gemmatimonadales bacterium]|nr:hypothetical protein [Gemmatimonadales bacterium]